MGKRILKLGRSDRQAARIGRPSTAAQHECWSLRVGVGFVLIMMCTVGVVTRAALADEQGCFYGADVDPRCPPEVHGIAASVIGVEYLTGGVVKLTLHIIASGEGFHHSGDNRVQLNVKWGIPGAGWSAVGGDSPGGFVNGTCQQVSGDWTKLASIDTSYKTLWVAAQVDQLDGGVVRSRCGSSVPLYRPHAVDQNGDTTWYDWAAEPQPRLDQGSTYAEFGAQTCELQETVADPINVTTGNEYIERTDVGLPTDLGLPITLTRHFNSQGLTTGLLGPKWRFGLEYDIGADTLGNITLTEPDGRQSLFLYHELIDTIADPDTLMLTTYTPSYGIPYLLDVDAVGNTYTFTRADYSKLVFDSLGPIDAISDQAGNEIQLSYSAGILSTVTNASGRTISYSSSGGKLTQITNASLGTVVSYFYDAGSGKLDSVHYADGTWEAYTYGSYHSDTGMIVAATTSDGSIRNYGYNPSGRANRYGRGSGHDSLYIQYPSAFSCSPCTDSAVTTVIHSDSQLVSEYYYTWSTDRTQREITHVVDGICGSCATGYGYGAEGRRDSVEYVNGTIELLEYDLFGRMISRDIGPDADTLIWSHRKYMYFPADTTADSSIAFSHIVENRLQSVANVSDSSTVTFTYDTLGFLDTRIDSGWVNASQKYGYATDCDHNAAGQLLRLRGPRSVGDSMAFVYNASTGDLQYEIEPNGDTTQYGARDALGQRTWIRGPNGDTTRFAFDKRGRLRKITYAAGTADSAVDTIAYNVDGDVTYLGSIGGSALTMTYNSAGYLTSIADHSGAFERYAYDNMGNRLGDSSFTADSTLRRFDTFRYDGKRRLLAAYDALGDSTRFTYDDIGTVRYLHDALLQSTFFDYDAWKRLIKTVEPGSGSGVTTEFKYNTLNDVDTVIDPDGFEYVYRYDDRRRLVYDSSGITGVTTYGYDEADNLIWEKNALGDSIAYRYDALNRLTQRLYPDSQNVIYEYDSTEYAYGRGRLFKEITAARTTKYQYDIRGRVIKETREDFHCPIYMTGDVNQNGAIALSDIIYLVNYVFKGGADPIPCPAAGDVNCTASITSADIIHLNSYIFKDSLPPCDVCPLVEDGTWSCPAGSATYVAEYSYDANDNLTSITYPSGTEVHYDYGNTDEVIRVRLYRYSVWDTLVTNLVYAPFGPADSIVLGNGLKIQRRHDKRYLIDSLKADTAGIVSLFYSYDAVGNVDSIADGVTSNRSRGFDYDEVGRLTAARSLDYPDSVVLYRYRKNGNRDMVISGVDTSVYVYTNNKLTSVTGTGSMTLSYDAVGNIVMEIAGVDTTTYDYNDAGRMIAIDTLFGNHYTYDGAHRRIRKRIYGDRWTYVVAATGQVLSEYDKDGWVSDYVYVNGQPLARIDGSGTFYFINDHLGTPLVLVDSTRTVRWSANWYPFGSIYDEVVSASNDIRFPGQWRDGESGLYYNWHRYYDPELGRYRQADPIRLTDGTNLFAYAHNAPTALTDPGGLYSWDEFVADWAEVTDIRAAKQYWASYGGPIGTIMSGLLEYSGLLTVQESAEILADPCEGASKKIAAGANTVAVGVAWYLVGSTVAKGGVSGSELSNYRIRIKTHPAHHQFRWLPGSPRLRHIQVTFYRKGVKDSAVNLRIPLPW